MTQLIRELQNADYLENINEIQFSLLSHQDIKKGSVADILTPDTYEGNIPKNNGLFDHNMGSIDAAIICPIDVPDILVKLILLCLFLIIIL